MRIDRVVLGVPPASTEQVLPFLDQQAKLVEALA
jgi:hypothetical protein